MSDYSSTPPYSSPEARPTNTMAIISLVAGILGLTLLPFLGSIVAVITGPMAKREIQNNGGAEGGEGLATAGIVMGWIGIGLGVLTFCLILLGFLFFIPFAVRSSSLILPSLLALV